MKAKEYYNKYKEAMFPVDEELGVRAYSSAGTRALVTDLDKEMFDLQENRKAGRPHSIAAIIKEQNQKWNAIVGLFEVDPDIPNLIMPARDGYIRLWVARIDRVGKAYKNERSTMRWNNELKGCLEPV